MQDKLQLLKLSYHFIAESIILFLVLTPVFYYTAGSIPYWSYLLSVIGACIFFAIISTFTNQFIWFVLTAPILFILFYVLHFPIFLSLMLSSVLVWRYIQIRKDELLENEMLYLQWTAFIVTIIVLFFQQYEAIFYLVLQFLILITGYYFSNILSADQKHQRKFIRTTAKILSMFIIIGAVALFALYQFITPLFMIVWDTIIVKLWHFLLQIIAFIFSIPIYLLSLLNLSPPEDMLQDPETMADEANENPFGTGENPLLENGAQYLYAFLIFTTIVLVVIFLIKMTKRKFKTDKSIHTGNSNAIVYHKEHVQKRPPIRERVQDFFSKKPQHPVRKIVFHFENKTARMNKGRKNFETIQEWASRIDLRTDMTVYEKVRYGHEEVKSEDVEQLKVALKKWLNNTN